MKNKEMGRFRIQDWLLICNDKNIGLQKEILDYLFQLAV